MQQAKKNKIKYEAGAYIICHPHLRCCASTFTDALYQSMRVDGAFFCVCSLSNKENRERARDEKIGKTKSNLWSLEFRLYLHDPLRIKEQFCFRKALHKT